MASVPLHTIITGDATEDDVDTFVSTVFDEQAAEVHGEGVTDRYSTWGFTARNSAQTLVAGVCGETYCGGLLVHRIFVEAESRKSGIGGRLLQLAMQYGREHGDSICTLETFDFQAPEYYQRHGFTVDFEHGGFPPCGPLRVLYFSRRISRLDADALPPGSVPAPGSCIPMHEGSLFTLHNVSGSGDDMRSLAEFLEAGFRQHASSALGSHSCKTPFCFVATSTCTPAAKPRQILGVTYGHYYWGCLNIEVLVVAKHSRMCGVGSALLRHVIEFAQRCSCSLVCLQTFDYQAPAFYERHGFSLVYRQPGWGAEQDASGHYTSAGSVNMFYRLPLTCTPAPARRAEHAGSFASTDESVPGARSLSESWRGVGGTSTAQETCAPTLIVRSLAELSELLHATLPRNFVETIDIAAYFPDSEAEVLAIIAAPVRLSATHVSLVRVPRTARPGADVHLTLAFNENYPCNRAYELTSALSSLALHVEVLALVGCDTACLPMRASVSQNAVIVCLSVPESAPVQTELSINAVRVAGELICVAPHDYPLLLAITRGMSAPLHLKASFHNGPTTPAISSDGVMYITGYMASDVLVYDAYGHAQHQFDLSALGLSRITRAAAFCNESNTLLLADANDEHSVLVAVDVTSRLLRWSVKVKDDCDGVAVLSALGLVFHGTLHSTQLFARRMSDGVEVAVCELPGESHVAYITADPATSTVYASLREGAVAIVRWIDGAFLFDGLLEAAGDRQDWRPLAVVPPSTRNKTAHLVVGTFGTPTLLVISLPDHKLVRSHTLGGMMIVGIAADASGMILGVANNVTDTVHVLPWPLDDKVLSYESSEPAELLPVS
jgi:GNAT superfamily N-acetyltransferase